MGAFAQIVMLAALLIVAGLLAVLLYRQAHPSSNGADLARLLSEQLGLGREESSRSARSLREELLTQLKNVGDTLVKNAGETRKAQHEQLESVLGQMNRLNETNQKGLDKLRETLSDNVRQMQESNEKKLEEMRKTVDEKLHDTLEKRLGESFKLVSDRLESVHKGLGEMKELADGVGDLKRVLTNVKARGTWGEVQLAAILEQILTPAQYERNVKTRPDSDNRVEFAIRLPGPDRLANSCVWLPIDSKFPQEDYLRLTEAADRADPEAVRSARTDLCRAVKHSAREIREKYLAPPHTTDFAVLFLPTEGLYAEVLREPGLVEDLQTTQSVVIAGPTTLSALLNSLRVGFRTLAIEQRSSEVWKVLGAVKTEFGKFGEALEKVRNQLGRASSSLENTGVRTRVMQRRLREVEELPEAQSLELLGLEGRTAETETETEEEE